LDLLFICSCTKKQWNQIFSPFLFYTRFVRK
jgi:hypothetical protein